MSGVAFFFRGVGDAGHGVVSWLSPIGWSQATRPYADERWWPLALPVVATMVLLAWPGGCTLAATTALHCGRSERRKASMRICTPGGWCGVCSVGSSSAGQRRCSWSVSGTAHSPESADRVVGDSDFAKQETQLARPLVRDSFPAVAMVVVARSHIDGGDGRAIDVLLALRGRSRAQVCQVSRANADDRLSLKPLGGVEGCDGIVEGCGGSDVRAQPSVPHPLHDLTQLSAIGLDNEIHC